jgi:hypothetical protein
MIPNFHALNGWDCTNWSQVTWDLGLETRVKWWVPTSMPSTAEIARIDLKWHGTRVQLMSPGGLEVYLTERLVCLVRLGTVIKRRSRLWWEGRSVHIDKERYEQAWPEHSQGRRQGHWGSHMSGISSCLLANAVWKSPTPTAYRPTLSKPSNLSLYRCYFVRLSCSPAFYRLR